MRIRALFIPSLAMSAILASGQMGVALAQSSGQADSLRRNEAAAAYNEGMVAFHAGRWAEAATKIERSISLIVDPNEQQMLGPAWFTLGAAYFNQPNYPRAIEVFKSYLEKFPAGERVMDVRLAMANAFVLNKNYDEALKLWEQLERIPAHRDRAIAAQIVIFKAQDKREHMVRMMEKLGGGELKTPLQARGAMQLATYYAELDRPDDALRVVNKVLAKPEIIDSLVPVNSTAIRLADALAEKQRYPEAIQTYRWVKPRSVVIRYSQERIALFERRIAANLANARGNPQAVAAANLQNNEIKSMIADQQAMLDEFEKLPDYAPALLFRQARCWYEWGRKWEAVVCYDRMLQLYPKAEEAEQAMYGIVLCYADLNQVKLTQEACERYLKEFPNGANAGTVGYLSGAVCLQAGDPKGAETFFGIMVEKQPDNPFREDMLMLIGHAKFMQGLWDDARKEYERYLAKYSAGRNKEEVTYRLACIDVFTGRYEEALKKLDAYLLAYPKGEYVPDAYYRIAVCYYAAEQYEEVAAKCEAWSARFPKDPMAGEVLSLLGDALAAQNKHEEAALAYERGYKAATTDEVLVYSLFEASKQMQKTGQWQRMASMFQEFVREQPEHQAAVAGMYWIGRAKAKLGEAEEAKVFLVEQAKKYIAEPKREAVENLLAQIAQLCLKRVDAKPLPQPDGDAAAAADRQLAAAVAAPEPPPWDPFAEYDRLTASLVDPAKPLTQARVMYGKGELYELKRQPQERRAIYAEIAGKFPAEQLSPILLGKVGDYLLETGQVEKAEAMYERLRTDFLKSEYLDFAYTGLGEIALQRKDYPLALERFDTALEKIGATFKIKEATIGKARALLELGRYDESRKLFEQVASIKEWRGEATALAVFSLGDIEARQGRYAEAIAHYRRVFVAYQKHLSWVARSYVKAAESFDQMGKRYDAIENLREMLRNEKLSALPEADQARQLLAKWGQA
jgi:TolA-binding protein